MLALAALAFIGGRQPYDEEWGDGWVWPVPPMRIGNAVYNPTISQEWKGERHQGVDIAYRRRNARDLVAQYPAGTHNGTPLFVAPPHTPILAAHAGEVWSVAHTARGIAVVLSHGPKRFATFYQHLESTPLAIHRAGVNVSTGGRTRVAAGQPLGFMGWDPSRHDAQKFRHLHFAVWHEGASSKAVDPGDAMTKWSRVPWAFIPTT
jgi:murein DD-endopeptidase MepM/ murein hydrolase activator NlpD